MAGVGDAVVDAVDDGHGENRLVAWLETASPGESLDRACHAALRSRLPSHMIPSEFVWLDKLPQAAGGKLDRSALRVPLHQTGLQIPCGRGSKPRDGIERKVAQVWESVLGISRLSRTDDFFELGATSLQAAEALVGLEQTFDLALSPAVLVEHTTVESLAAVIADRAVARSGRCLVSIRRATSGRPVFLVHSGHGDVATYGALARLLHERPVYGLQAVGLQGESWPQMSIGAMARRYLPEILEAHPDGPYLLGGTCMGGLVAFELACLLVRQKRDVLFVGMMETTALPFSGRRSPWNEMLLDPIRDTLRIVRWAVLRALGFGRRGRSLPAYRHFVGSVTSRARFYYRPRYYPGRITVFATADTAFRRDDRRRLMGRYAKEMRFITVPGRREDLFLQPALDQLAKQLQSCLDEAESASSVCGSQSR